MNVNVGDEVVVIEGKYHHRVPVDRVARKYFYVRAGTRGEKAFEIETGREKALDRNYPNHYNARAYTPEAYDQEMHSRCLRERLRHYDVTLGPRGPFYRGLPDSAIENILKILDAEVQS